eukprot:CAMPEP_0175061872 /NCGR_PEP_ID=MMETSP0052_2-20121109/13835_1 /TAXON_ID=51329 ORGANISM="Polytomella parva, Strain SAG 63-3" /NCGR_SAMPLE_ID=MMETSP0052_2 /ASSEMBLY_ACC=CAM_ASM_000194 /LENGTH=352 /DNA_ID=CAMNT_0016327793 /DNA_START=10 /DNA_END=1068 /DNA_ORIENTATION=-
MSDRKSYDGEDLEDDIFAAGSKEDEEDEKRYNELDIDEAEEGSGEEEEERPKKKKKGDDNDEKASMQLVEDVNNFILKMQATSEKDREVYTKNLDSRPGARKEPAVAKLRMLKEVEAFLSQKRYHQYFIDFGGLGALTSWIEPYSDGSLPNINVRSTILKCLTRLPLDTGIEEHKEILKKSQLGQRVMFYSRCPDETVENRRIASELVQRWSRQVFFDRTAEDRKCKLREDQLAEGRKQYLKAQQQNEERRRIEDDQRRGKPSRIHATIPAPPRLDFVRNPGRSRELELELRESESSRGDESSSIAAVASGGNAKGSRFLLKRHRDILRKKKGGDTGMLKPSMEGRNLVIRD